MSNDMRWFVVVGRLDGDEDAPHVVYCNTPKAAVVAAENSARLEWEPFHEWDKPGREFKPDFYVTALIDCGLCRPDVIYNY